MQVLDAGVGRVIEPVAAPAGVRGGAFYAFGVSRAGAPA